MTMPSANLNDWTSVITLVFTAASVIGGAMYLRGKLDTQTAVFSDNVSRLIDKVDGLDADMAASIAAQSAQEVVNRSIDKIGEQAQATRDLANAAVIRLDSHERECKEHRVSFDKRLDRLDRGQDGINRQLANLLSRDRSAIREFRVDEST